MINGKDEFYKGETAKKLVKFINENGGIITMEDLEVYEAVWRDPVVFNYDDLKIISMSSQFRTLAGRLVSTKLRAPKNSAKQCKTQNVNPFAIPKT